MVNLLSIVSLLCIGHPAKLGQKAPANKSNISQPITLDLETRHSNDIDRPAIRTDQTRSVGAVIANDQRLAADKRDKIIHSVNLHEELGPAVSRLPPELLIEIFMQTLPSFDKLSLPPSERRSPMLLTRICRRWREVAVGTPSLWCRLFGGLMSSQRRHSQQAFCYKTWLKRSRGLPLSLVLMYRQNPLTCLLQPYTSQISCLHIVYTAATRDLLLNDLPTLQVLFVDGWISDFPYEGTSTITRPISNHSFTLRSLKVSRLSFSCYTGGFDFFKNSRWPHLTHVEITVYQQDVLLRLLQQAPNLSSAKISMASNYTAHPPLPVEPYTHTKLQFLHIDCSKPHLTIHSLLNALSLPNLRYFIADTFCMQCPHEEFKAFLARSKCPLEFVSFGDAMTVSELDALRAKYVTHPFS